MIDKPFKVIFPGHRVEPKPGSWIRESDRKPADMLAIGDYPIMAVCRICNRNARAETLLREFQHIE